MLSFFQMYHLMQEAWEGMDWREKQKAQMDDAKRTQDQIDQRKREKKEAERIDAVKRQQGRDAWRERERKEAERMDAVNKQRAQQDALVDAELKARGVEVGQEFPSVLLMKVNAESKQMDDIEQYLTSWDSPTGPEDARNRNLNWVTYFLKNLPIKSKDPNVRQRAQMALPKLQKLEMDLMAKQNAQYDWM